MIKELYRQGVSISDIARQTGRDRKTIRKLVNAPLLSVAKPRAPKARLIDPYVAYLEQRMEEGVFNARKLYGEIAAQGYPGRETQIRAFVHTRRPPTAPAATVRFETPAFAARASRLGPLRLDPASGQAL
jgi:transposase